MRNHFKRTVNYINIVLLLLTISFFACPKKVKPPVTQKEITPQVEPTKEVTEASIRGDEFISVPELKNVYFDYDKFDLTEESKSILRKNVEFLLANPQYDILVEGHCCECGTNDYNLALGQKRASTVREYYISLGVPANKIATISYGEEKPVNRNAGPPDSPLCKFNRRAETKVRTKK
ncbi:MAG: OmpA family protein [Endomicrobia bacterium]|nr:OmpA family protein [Endomicrobiia bacterium]MDW8055955.1 OmpA family protein [Elusimicrobiota bacterium]